MHPIHTITLSSTLLTCLLTLAPTAHAQTATVTYDLKDVWLLPDVSHPRSAAQQMTGTFVWTYTVGQFDQGSGKFTNLSIPWWGTRTVPAIKVLIERKAIEITMVGSYHDYGLDVTLRLAPELSRFRPSPIDTSSAFDIQVGVSHKGHVQRGSVVPRCAGPVNYGRASAGSGQFVPTIQSAGGDPRIGNGAFQIQVDRLLGGASCFFVIGAAKAEFPLLGVTVLVDPGSWLLFPLQAGGSAGVPGAGTLRITLPIPNDPLLVGSDFDFQTVALDPGSPTGMAAATDGLAVSVCH